MGDLAEQLGAMSAELALALQDRVPALLDLWEALGAGGPTGGSPEAGDQEEARQRYLLPLARVLLGALKGSAEHRAVYLDERLRYVDPALDVEARAAHLRPLLATESAALVDLLQQVVEPETVVSALAGLHRPLTDPAAPEQRLMLIGDCLFVETRAFLVPERASAGRPLDVRQLFFSARQPVDAVNTAVVEGVSRYRPDLIGISLFTFEGVPPYAAAWQQAARPWAARQAVQMVPGLLALLAETISDIRTVSDCTIAVHQPAGLPLDRVRRRVPALPPHSRTQRRLLELLGAGVQELVAGTTNTVLVDEPLAVAGIGGPRRAARPVFDEHDVPAGYSHTTRLGPALAEQYSGLLDDHALLGRSKALLVDFDNTLWAGVMAEGPVEHDVTGQRLLKELKDAGVLLVALSKNDPLSIRWDELALTPDDFVLQKIDWRPKPENVSAAVHELDLAPDAFVLLDDNPAERALVTEQVPGVRALDPAAPASWRALRRWLDMPSTGQTDEARRRTRMYREAAQRRAALSPTHDYPTMMRSLALQYEVRPATAADLARVLELVQRTNQFNTTTHRRSTAEVEQLLQGDEVGVHVATLKDRFGDLGVVALSVFDRRRRAFDSVVMSCRAMGFGLEIALVADVLTAEGAATATGRFVPTARNSPAADLFERAGFVQVQDGEWLLSGAPTSPPAWLERTGRRA